MFTFEVKQGLVSNKQDMQHVSGRVHNGHGHVKTKHTTVCNIGDQMVQLNGSGGIYFSEDDEVLAIGQTDSAGVFHIAGFKNLSTGVIQKSATIIPFIMAICLLGLGVMTFFLVITPIIFIPLGLLCLWNAIKNVNANKFLISVIPT